MFRQLDKVPDGDESVSGSGQSHADSVVCLEEANLSLVVASDQRQQDDVILLALIIVHCGDSNAREIFSLHQLFECEELAGVGGQNSNLVSRISLF